MDYSRLNKALLTQEFRVIATVKGLGLKMGTRPASIEFLVAGRFCDDKVTDGPHLAASGSLQIKHFISHPSRLRRLYDSYWQHNINQMSTSA